MSNLRNFINGNRPPKSIVNAYSDSGFLYGGTPMSISDSAGKNYLSGVLTATVWKEVLSVTGSGRIIFIGCKAIDNTSRSIGLRVTIDGTVVFETISGEGTSWSGGGPVAIGSGTNSVGGVNSDGVGAYYNSSFKVEIYSSLTETDKVKAIVNYEVY